MEMTRRNVIAAGLIGSVGLGAGARLAAAQDTPQPPAAKTGPLKVQVILFDGFEVIDGLGPFDALQIASKVGAGFTTTLTTVNGASEVTALDGVGIKTPTPFDPEGDLVIVPGAPQLWRNGETPAGLEAALLDFHAAGKTIASVCTGAVWLARSGLLNGRNATTHHNAFEVIQGQGANVIKARVVDDGDIISSAGVTSGIDLAIYLVERYYGSQLAFATEQIIEHERRGAVWRREG